MGADGLTGIIEVVGLGVGGEPGPEAMERIRAARVLAAGARLLDRFPSLPGKRIILASPLEEALDAVAKARDQGLSVVVLADGDPLFFGIGSRLVERFGREALRFTPGVSAVAAACARLGLAWHDLPAVSLHGRDDPTPLLAALCSHGLAAVYTDRVNSPDALARLLLGRGLDEAALWVLEDLGTPDEKVRRLSLPETAGLRFSPLNLVIVEAGSDRAERPVLGRPDDFYASEGGLITKWPARACALAALGLRHDSVLWDVGSGSGAVAVEACALIRAGRVFAVERDPGRCGLIRENIRRCRAWLAQAVEGQAPEAFASLPDPDRIFLGGGLGGASPGDAPRVLAEACSRLKPGGRLVANIVLLGSLHAALDHLASLGWAVETSQVQASLSSPLAGDIRLAALNPVFIVRADKPSVNVLA